MRRMTRLIMDRMWFENGDEYEKFMANAMRYQLIFGECAVKVSWDDDTVRMENVSSQ